MTDSSRSRILKAVNHEEADRLPIDLGGTDCSSIAVGPYRKLCDALSVDAGPCHIVDICQQIAIVDDRVADAVGSDAKVIWHLPEEWRDGEAYDGLPAKFPGGFDPELLPGGDRIVRDRSGNACLKMPAGGYYYDVCSHPLEHLESHAGLDRYDEYFDTMDRPPWYDMPLERLAETVGEIRRENDRALVGCFGGHIFQAGQFLRGWSQFLMDLVGRPAMAQAIMEKLTQAHIRAFDRYADTVYKHVDIIEVCDDMGMQNATWISPKTYRESVKPYHEMLYGHIKERTGAKLLLHSCGSVSSLIPDFIEIGVDILNPVQYTAREMDLKRLKRDFGADICFWGGGVDTQKTLAFGTPEQVSDEVKRCIDILAPGGGFVFSVVHNVTEGVPLENILAAFETARAHGA